MKKAAILFLLVLFFHASRSQDVEVGYSTTDIGAEFQWYPSGTISGLHLAFNSKIHHSVLVKFGYNKTDRKDNGEKDNEKGSGWGGTLGYRYYFRPFPHKFFIGAKTDIWRMKIDWVQGAQTGESRTWTLQPAFEIGYTFIINDQAFITPSISNGVQINIKTEGDKVGQGFITLIGISAGFRL